MLETQYVRVGLINPAKEIFNPETGSTVSGKEILKQMKINNVWKNDHEGRYAAVMYSGQTFKFREGGMYLTLPHSLAKSLRMNSAICVGSDKLNGPIIPFLEIVEQFELQEPKSTAVSKAPTCCPICGEDQKSFPALARHMGVEKKKHPELFKEDAKDWDGKTVSTGATDGEEADV